MMIEFQLQPNDCVLVRHDLPRFEIKVLPVQEALRLTGLYQDLIGETPDGLRWVLVMQGDGYSYQNVRGSKFSANAGEVDQLIPC